MKARIRRYFEELETWDIYAKLLIALSLAFMFIRYDISLWRLIFSIKDLLLSLAHWFLYVSQKTIENIFGSVPVVDVSVTDIPKIDYDSFLPFELETLINKIKNFDQAFFDLRNFLEFNVWLLYRLYQITYYVTNFFMFPYLIFYTVREYMICENELPLGHRSVGVIRFESLLSKCKPKVDGFNGFINKFCDNKKYRNFFVFIWLVNFNVLTIGIEVFAFFYYFISSFDVISIGVQTVKLGIDVMIFLFGGSLILWAVISFLIFDHLRKKRGYDVLDKHEAENCGFCKSTNTCSIIVGPMGLGKTALATDMTASWVNIFKCMSQDILFAKDMLFPMFPYELFEWDIKEMTLINQIYTPVSVDLFVDELESRYNRTPSPAILYNYDYELHGVTKNVGNKIVSLFDVLRDYGKAYFVYINENPSLANYPIRFDGKFKDNGFFPLWNGDFFESEPGERESRYSHILDQDIMRMGTLVRSDNPLAGSFSFGIYTNTEFGKGRGNQLTLQGIDKNAEESNQKNDLYAYALKMCRHASVMIDGKVFFRFIGDEQRPQSIAQDLRDLCSIISIEAKSEIKLAMPFFAVEEWIYKKIYEPFKSFYYDYKNVRGDITLPLVLVKLFVSMLSNYYQKIYNTFGYFELDLKLEAGTAYGDGAPSDSKAEIHKYYLAIKKIYSDRYSTDCYQQFFSKRQLESDFGINTYPEYESLKMSYEEMEQQHDFFIMDLMKIMSGEKELSSVKSSEEKQNKRKDSFAEAVPSDFEFDFIEVKK